MSDLDAFVKRADENSPFLIFQDATPVEGVYKGCKMVENTYTPGTQIMQYSLAVQGSEKTVVKTWKSASVKLAKLMMGIEEGDRIQVVKTGNAGTTQWFIKKMEEKE